MISVCPMTDNVHFGHLTTVVPSDFSIFVTSLPFVINILCKGILRLNVPLVIRFLIYSQFLSLWVPGFLFYAVGCNPLL